MKTKITMKLPSVLRFLSLIFLIIVLTELQAQNAQTFTIGNVEAKPGERASGKIIIEKGVDEGTFIPITIINGTKPGPVLTLDAGMHGTEYVPVITLQKLNSKIDPQKLSGTLILVHIANLPGFQDWQVYLNPVDRKNLNRSFPGKKDGTLSERIAHAISNQILKKSDYYIDMHGGEFNERIVDYVYFIHGSPEKELCKKSLLMAQATGNKYLIPYNYSADPDSLPSEYSDTEAYRLGVPTISLEWGDRGIVHPEELTHAIKGIINVMRSLGMLQGESFKNEHPVYLFNNESTFSAYDGILYMFIDKGQYITKGTMVGYTTDYWGKTLEKYYAPVSGIVVSLKIGPAINKGSEVFEVAEARDELK